MCVECMNEFRLKRTISHHLAKNDDENFIYQFIHTGHNFLRLDFGVYTVSNFVNGTVRVLAPEIVVYSFLVMIFVYNDTK